MKREEPSRPLPHANSDNLAFWDYCKQHELRFQKCLSCGHIRWPASILCCSCYSQDTKWCKSEGRGTVHTYAVYHHAFHPAFKKDIPYVTAIIALDEGPHFLSNIVDCAPADLYCGMPVEVIWRDTGEGLTLPLFRPA